MRVSPSLIGSSLLVGVLALSGLGCPRGSCFFRFKQVQNGKVVSDQCLVDSCPDRATFDNARNSCVCQAPTLLLAGACVMPEQAAAQCGPGYRYDNGGCVAITCPPGQILNAATKVCQNQQAADQVAAAQAHIDLKPNQTITCPPGDVYVFDGKEGACVQRDASCGTGTRWDGSRCVAIACAAGQVLTAAGVCEAVVTADGRDVQKQLTASMGPGFCAPHVNNPAAFNVGPNQTLTLKVAVTVTVPNNDVSQAQATSVHVTNVGGAELTPAMYPGVAAIHNQVHQQVVGGIKAMGGKSLQPQASAEVQCVIKRTQVIITTRSSGL